MLLLGALATVFGLVLSRSREVGVGFTGTAVWARTCWPWGAASGWPGVFELS